MEVLVGGDDGRRRLRALQELPEVRGDKVGADPLRDLRAPLRAGLGDPDPLDAISLAPTVRSR
ncbi:MAG: hypothetical protein HY725_10770 [Candidatus Rokubacteria bacterium]|nr:hypothetical protein [Candidatus Rokubacteria bacterium]